MISPEIYEIVIGFVLCLSDERNGTAPFSGAVPFFKFEAVAKIPVFVKFVLKFPDQSDGDHVRDKMVAGMPQMPLIGIAEIAMIRFRFRLFTEKMQKDARIFR